MQGRDLKRSAVVIDSYADDLLKVCQTFDLSNCKWPFLDYTLIVYCTGFAAEEAVAQLAIQHLKIRAFATPAVIVIFVVNGAFRGFKDTK